MFGNFFNGPGGGGGTFEASYRCYPVSFIDKVDAEAGDKVFLPPSALDRLATLHIEYPMLFKIENRKDGNSTHCGVLEFVADEGMIYLPYWMMQNLLLREGDIVKVKSAALPKGTFVKLQPHTQDFLDITNPKAVLETTLRGYSCLTVGDCIVVHYNNKRYYIDVIEARPGNAISVIETDCEVDFAPPLDYVEPSREEPAAPTPMEEEPSAAPEPEEPEEPKFLPFVGAGRRLDGKPSPSAGASSSSGAAQPSTSAASAARPAPARAAAPPSSSGAGPSGAAASGSATGAAAAKGGRPAGKLVFGGGNRLAAAREAKAPEPKKEEPPKDEGPKFQAFSGRANTLK